MLTSFFFFGTLSEVQSNKPTIRQCRLNRALSRLLHLLDTGFNPQERGDVSNSIGLRESLLNVPFFSPSL